MIKLNKLYATECNINNPATYLLGDYNWIKCLLKSCNPKDISKFNTYLEQNKLKMIELIRETTVDTYSLSLINEILKESEMIKHKQITENIKNSPYIKLRGFK